jgi:homoserine kinase
MTTPLRFRVPASTTNLAHGFDCLGIALGLANVITVTPDGSTAVTAPGAADPGLQPMAERVRAVCAAAWGRAIPGFAVAVAGEVPIARGMGSSATILCGVAAACRELAGLPADPGAVLTVAAAIEGHPDNVAAAVLGGVTVVGAVGSLHTGASGLRWAKIAVPTSLIAVVAIPPFEVKTSEARKILPHELSRAEAIRGLQRTALITAALAQGRAEDLRGLFADGWHEQYRAPLNHGFAEARAAAETAGAVGTIISGSGSTVLSFAQRERADAIREAIAGSYTARGVNAAVRIVEFDNGGLTRLA